MIHTPLITLPARLRRRLGAEDGFTMMIALGVLVVTTLLVGAAFIAVNGDVNITRHDLDAKRAYYAARSGENAFLYQLNQNPNYWTTCSNDYQPTPVGVPGATNGETYSYVPVYNVGYSNTNCTTPNVIAALIDAPSGTLRIEFTGYAGTPTVTRTIVASFRKRSPLDYLWYTDHETRDPVLASDCQPPNNGAIKYWWQYTGGATPPADCQVNWVTGDVMSGPLYTNDQYLVYQGNAPVFGRPGSNDSTQSNAPKIYGICVRNNCQKAVFNGLGAQPAAQSVALPSSNSSTKLLQDAQANGLVLQGTTTITLQGSSEIVTNCPGTTATASCSTQQVTEPIIYVQNGSGCPSAYALDTSYPKNSSGYYGACGNVYVSGTYSNTSLTIVSDQDIIIVANNTPSGPNTGITTSEDAQGNPIGDSMLGLVAADFVRVMHSSSSTGPIYAITIDAAILTLAHSFIVDNFDAGKTTQPKLTIHGAIAQRFRGAVGQVGSTGYLKDYHYDDRLKVLLPPYLFDIAISGWQITRETLCTPSSDPVLAAAHATDPAYSQYCFYQGT